mgnify:FL=1
MNGCPNDEREESLCVTSATSSLGESESGLVGLFSAAPYTQVYVSQRASVYQAGFDVCPSVLLASTHRADWPIENGMEN